MVLYGIFCQDGQFAGPKFGPETFRFGERVPLAGHENSVLVSTDNKVIRRKNPRNIYRILIKKLLFAFQKAQNL